jgi:hypothetical protein
MVHVAPSFYEPNTPLLGDRIKSAYARTADDEQAIGFEIATTADTCSTKLIAFHLRGLIEGLGRGNGILLT